MTFVLGRDVYDDCQTISLYIFFCGGRGGGQMSIYECSYKLLSCSYFFFGAFFGGGGGNEYLDLQIRVKNWQLFPNQNICCGYSVYHLKAYV